MKIVSAADANRRFSEILRDVRSGTTFVVTVHGKAVARIEATNDRMASADQARDALLARLTSQRAIRAAKWTRASLYEEP